MIYEHRRKFIIGLIVFTVVVAGAFIYREVQNSVTVDSIESADQDSYQTPVVSIDNTSIVSSEFSSTQLQGVRQVIKQRLGLEAEEKLRGTVRDGSLITMGDSVQFIVDIAQRRTSFLVDRTRGEDFDIVNVFCVPQDRKIYESDGCREE